MEDRYFTIGMAGHIDHGKTSLTKALTGVDTDRLKEEKERNISIEAGYAPLQTEDGTHISIVDVPGHERFIRQMIAGVAGIDLVVLVIAADEGVMPQTEEHLEILKLLGIQKCVVAISKIDRTDSEMLEIVTEDIQERLVDSVFEGAPFVHVDSLSGTGVKALKDLILQQLKEVPPRDAYGSFRLPIDQVFTAQGQGVIVRGTVYEGVVRKGSQLLLLPGRTKVKVRQVQVHRQEQEQARAGQRAALNLGGVTKEEIVRGDVLVASDAFLVTDTIDVALQVAGNGFAPLKQRAPVKVHVGTSEVMGKIVFFDRNELTAADGEVLCQIRLDEEVVVRRGDRFILRRPTPVATIGGGWIIQAGAKYRFGEETVAMLRSQQQGSPADLLEDLLRKQPALGFTELLRQISMDEPALLEAIDAGLADGTLLEMQGQRYSMAKTFTKITEQLSERLQTYHEKLPMRIGIGKAELVQSFSADFPEPFIEYSLNELVKDGVLRKTGQYISLQDFSPHMPKQWKTRMEGILAALAKDGLQAEKWEEYTEGTPIPKADISELLPYLIHTHQVIRLTEDTVIHRQAFDQGVEKLRSRTSTAFGLKEAKEILGVSRKYLIPFLELLDVQKLTIREEEQRVWSSKSDTES
ncbi:MAG TPA: selenocysteine-specific translation elongation factor [Planococcus sp. (in: firmicutes)]|nr:selenocysteine-specific translation elongation factor [Planococcus sp. (in: firmicutes)]